MGRWVYRRPHFPAWKPKIPLARPGILPQPRRRRYWRPARRYLVQARPPYVVLSVAAQQVAGKVFVPRPKIRIRLPRPQAAHVKILLNRARAGQPVQLRRRVNKKPARPGLARPKIVLKRQQQAGHAIVRALRKIQRPQRIQPTKRAPAPGGRFEGKQGPIRRLLKAIQRMREGMQRRLLFRPKEIPPIIVPQPIVHAISRGEIVTAGAVEGDVTTAVAVRGEVYG